MEANWIDVKERLPRQSDADENGKVLIYRIVTDTQTAMSKSIMDYNMVRHMDEGFWTTLPAPPEQLGAKEPIRNGLDGLTGLHKIRCLTCKRDFEGRFPEINCPKCENEKS